MIPAVSRNRKVFKSFLDLAPDLRVAMAACIEAESALIDGEIVYLGRDGRPEFYNLMRRRSPQHFYAFDILWLDGRDLRGLPFVKRKQILRRVVPIQPGVVLYVDHFDERGVDLFRVVCESDLEGIWNTNAQESEGFLWGGAAASGCPAVTHHEA